MPQREPFPYADEPDLVARLTERGGGTLAARLGIEFVAASADRCVATMPVEGNTQPFGLLHGGATAALAETVGSVAAVLHAGRGGSAVGVELTCSHHKPARHGLVTGTATAITRGGTLACYEIVVSDEAGTRISTCRLTCVIRKGPSAESASSEGSGRR